MLKRIQFGTAQTEKAMEYQILYFMNLKMVFQVIDGDVHLNRNHYYPNGKLRKEICTPNTTLSFNYRTLKTKYYKP